MPSNVDYNATIVQEADNYWELWERLPRAVRDVLNEAPLAYAVKDAWDIYHSDPFFRPDFDDIMRNETRRLSATGVENGNYKLRRRTNVNDGSKLTGNKA